MLWCRRPCTLNKNNMDNVCHPVAHAPPQAFYHYFVFSISFSISGHLYSGSPHGRSDHVSPSGHCDYLSSDPTQVTLVMLGSLTSLISINVHIILITFLQNTYLDLQLFPTGEQQEQCQGWAQHQSGLPWHHPPIRGQYQSYWPTRRRHDPVSLVSGPTWAQHISGEVSSSSSSPGVSHLCVSHEAREPGH